MRILNLQPLESGGELDALLLEAGFDVERLPMLSLKTLPCPELAKLNPGDLLVFTSAQGARSTADNLTQAVENFQVLAIGPHTAEVAGTLGFKVKLTAEASHSAGLAAAIAAKIPTDAPLILCRGDSASRELPEALRAAGFKLRLFDVYTATPRKLSEEEQRLDFDAVIATSSLSLKAFVEQVPAARIPTLLGLPLIVIGPKTALTAGELGFWQIVQAASPSLAAILEACGNLKQ